MSIEHVTIARDGRVVIPAALRKQLALQPGDTLTVEADGRALVLRSLDEVVRDNQAYFRQFVPAGVSLVDDLLAERRTEAAREVRELDESLAQAPRA